MFSWLQNVHVDVSFFFSLNVIKWLAKSYVKSELTYLLPTLSDCHCLLQWSLSTRFCLNLKYGVISSDIPSRYGQGNHLLVSQLPSIQRTFRKDYKILQKGIIFILMSKLIMFQPIYQMLLAMHWYISEIIHSYSQQNIKKRSQLVWFWFELHEEKCTSLWKDMFKIS